MTMGRHSPPLNGTLMPFTVPPSMQPPVPKPAARRAVSARVMESCYALMAVVTVIGTAVGFWLSYAGLHSFAVQAGLSGPEAWAWPASVDLFILVGELGITISTLRDGRADWRAWGYFAAGCGPSITFNVLHVMGHFPPWGKYAVAATPPVAAVLALAALMQQVISLPDALRHMHARQEPVTPPAVTPAVTPARDKPAAIPPRKPAMTQKAKAAAAIRDNPGMTNAELARRAGVDVRTIQRVRNGSKT